MSDTITLPDVGTDTRDKTDRQPPYAVLLHNDDLNTMDWVILVLRKVFGYTVEKCVQLMLEAHNNGCTVVWVGTMEVAELKADQIIGCGPDPNQKDRGAETLRVTVEPTE